MTQMNHDDMNKKLFTDTAYRKFVAWTLMRYGLQIAYDQIDSTKGLNKAYKFTVKHAPLFQMRFLGKAFMNGFYALVLSKNDKPLRTLDYKNGIMDPIPSNILIQPKGKPKYTKAIRVAQVMGMDIWGMTSPHSDDGSTLQKPYQPFANEILSIIIP